MFFIVLKMYYTFSIHLSYIKSTVETHILFANESTNKSINSGRHFKKFKKFKMYVSNIEQIILGFFKI